MDREAQNAMNAPDEAALEVSLPKAFLFSAPCMLSFVLGLFVIGVPMNDPLLIAFIIITVAGTTLVFTICFCFMLRCKISRRGLCPAVPTFYSQVIPWEKITSVRGFASPFYMIRCSTFGPFCILPRRFFLKHPESLRQLLERYAPPDNIVRNKLAA